MRQAPPIFCTDLGVDTASRLSAAAVDSDSDRRQQPALRLRQGGGNGAGQHRRRTGPDYGRQPPRHHQSTDLGDRRDGTGNGVECVRRLPFSAPISAWTPRLASLPRPWIAILIGGSSPPFAFDKAAGTALGSTAAELARTTGGSLLVTTSPRTSAIAATALATALNASGASHFLHRSRRGHRVSPLCRGRG